MPHAAGVDERHLRSWLGTWPPARPVHVVGSERRVEPGWDGAVRALDGVATSDGAVPPVPPAAEERVATALDELGAEGAPDLLAALGDRLPELLDLPGARCGRGAFPSSTEPAVSDDPGVWLPPGDPRAPAWLRPFNGDVPVYLHAATNVASARTADASGFPDVGWRILGLFGGAAGAP